MRSLRHWIDAQTQMEAEHQIEAQLHAVSDRSIEIPVPAKPLPGHMGIRFKNCRMYCAGEKSAGIRIDGPFHVDADELTIVNKGERGVVIGPSAYFSSRRGIFRSDPGINIDNYGRFDSMNDRFG